MGLSWYIKEGTVLIAVMTADSGTDAFPSQITLNCLTVFTCVSNLCLTSVLFPPHRAVWKLSPCSGDAVGVASLPGHRPKRAGAQSAKLARWVQLLSINCGNATQPLAALCRNNQIITYTLSQREDCLSGHAVEDATVKWVTPHLPSYCIISPLLYFHLDIRLLANFMLVIIPA